MLPSKPPSPPKHWLATSCPKSPKIREVDSVECLRIDRACALSRAVPHKDRRPIWKRLIPRSTGIVSGILCERGLDQDIDILRQGGNAATNGIPRDGALILPSQHSPALIK